MLTSLSAVVRAFSKFSLALSISACTVLSFHFMVCQLRKGRLMVADPPNMGILNVLFALSEDVLKLAPKVIDGYQLRFCALTDCCDACRRYSAARRSGRLAKTVIGTSKFTPLTGNRRNCAGSAAMFSDGLKFNKLRKTCFCVSKLFCKDNRLFSALSNDCLAWVG